MPFYSAGVAFFFFMCTLIMCKKEFAMNLTLSIDAETLKRAREVARRQGKSVNQLIREYLERLTGKEVSQEQVRELFELMEQAKGSLKGRKWNRDEIHER
ncbi:MAG: CopG family transcriptional regulator [Deltaproteobacteria bacterium]|nr:MAG: CopG family transcriptional regulator [Deltaproteobacteria bacterium]